VYCPECGSKLQPLYAYVRWHGHSSPTWYNYDYSPEELGKWVPKVKELAQDARRVYGYFNNRFRWQVPKGINKWGYPGAAKNLVEFLDVLGIANERQREVLKRIDSWIERKGQLNE